MSTIVVEPNGTIKLIYEDDLRSLLDEGHADVKRVSHVEPCADGEAIVGWIADLAPVNGPVFGPFDTRKEALDAEVAYLINNVL